MQQIYAQLEKMKKEIVRIKKSGTPKKYYEKEEALILKFEKDLIKLSAC